MQKNNLYVHLAISLSILCFSSVSLAQSKPSFSPQQEPILNTPQPKANIHMVLDDSLSMTIQDVYMLEHSYGQGNPVCNVDAAAVRWGKERE